MVSIAVDGQKLPFRANLLQLHDSVHRGMGRFSRRLDGPQTHHALPSLGRLGTRPGAEESAQEGVRELAVTAVGF